jgi:hypothetical protein
MSLVALAALTLAAAPAPGEACPGLAPLVDRGERESFVDRYVAASAVDERCFGPLTRDTQHIFYFGTREGSLTVYGPREEGRGRAYLGVDIYRRRSGAAVIYVSHFIKISHGNFCRSVLPAIAGHDLNWIRRAAEACFREMLRAGFDP